MKAELAEAKAMCQEANNDIKSIVDSDHAQAIEENVERDTKHHFGDCHQSETTVNKGDALKDYFRSVYTYALTNRPASLTNEQNTEIDKFLEVLVLRF